MFNTAVRTLLPVLGAQLHAPVWLPTTGCFPRTYGQAQTPQFPMSSSTHFSIIIFWRIFPKAEQILPHVLSHGLAPTAPSLPSGSLHLCQTNEHFFVCSGTLSFLLQVWVFRITVFLFLGSFLRLPLRDHFSCTSTSLLLLFAAGLCYPWCIVPLIHDLNDAFAEVVLDWLIALVECLYYEYLSS